MLELAQSSGNSQQAGRDKHAFLPGPPYRWVPEKVPYVVGLGRAVEVMRDHCVRRHRSSAKGGTRWSIAPIGDLAFGRDPEQVLVGTSAAKADK